MLENEMRSKEQESLGNIQRSGDLIINICFIMRKKADKRNQANKDQFFLRRVQIRNDEDTQKELIEMFWKFLKDRLGSGNGTRIVDLSAGEESKDAIYHYDYDNHPDALYYFWNCPEMKDVQDFNMDEDDLSQLFGYIIRLDTSDNDTLLLFKKHYSFATIRKTRTFLGFAKKVAEDLESIVPRLKVKMPAEDELYMLKNDTDLLQIDGTVHMIKKGDKVYVLDPRVFEQLPGVEEMITKTARATVAAIDKLQILADMDLINTCAGDLRSARKMAKIGKKSEVFEQLESRKLMAQDIVRFSQEDFLGGQFQLSEDGKKIKVTNKKSVEALLNLLSDSYLMSKLTGTHYTSHVKDKLEMGGQPH